MLLWLFFAGALGQSLEDVQLLQTHSTSPSSWDGGFWTREVFADASLYEVMASCEGNGISKECWISRFPNFDRNGDGVISAKDLQANTKRLGPAQKNFTRQEVRIGLALAAKWFPHEASKLIMHTALITELMMQNDFSDAELDKVPPPPDPLPKMKSNMPDSISVAGGGNMSLLQPDCVQGVFKVVLSSMNLIFGILGVPTPSETVIPDFIESKISVIERIVSVAHGDSEEVERIALKVWQIFDILHEEGIFSQILEDTVKSLSWWKASLVIVRVAATVASWYASGTALLLLQIGLAVPNAADLISGLKDVHTKCKLPL